MFNYQQLALQKNEPRVLAGPVQLDSKLLHSLENRFHVLDFWAFIHVSKHDLGSAPRARRSKGPKGTGRVWTREQLPAAGAAE